MHKSKQAVSKTVDSLAEELRERFTGLTFEPILEPEDGHDAWLFVFLPRACTASEGDVRKAARELEDEHWRKSGVSVVSMIREQKEPVHG